ncbi:unnamed protein product [Paramecium sonneborni]|uniref:Uncharacterized protein n=1 Tax=Paramecium sonneborni TaxID=65129 RepID=A0A8S1RF40_9CILI|nr:unnamed protein product [Paramecium sonneborni]
MNQDIVIKTEIIKHGLEKMLLYILQLEQEQYQNQSIFQTKIEQLGIQTIFVLANQKLKIQNQNVIIKSLSNNLEKSTDDIYQELYLNKKNVALIITKSNKNDIYLLFYSYMILKENKNEIWITRQNISQEQRQLYYDLIVKIQPDSCFFESQFINTNIRQKPIENISQIIDQQKPEQMEDLNPPQLDDTITNLSKEQQPVQNQFKLQNLFLETNIIVFQGQKQIKLNEINQDNNDNNNNLGIQIQDSYDQLQPPPEQEESIREFPPKNPFQFFSKYQQIKC